MAKQQQEFEVRVQSDPQKLLAATEAVTAALVPLTHEERMRVLKAIAILFEIAINN